MCSTQFVSSILPSGFGFLRPPAWKNAQLSPLRYGSDFSGMDAVACALFVLGVPVRYLFANEVNVQARSFLLHNHRP